MSNKKTLAIIANIKESMTIRSISKYRKELMGIAIIGVMVNHWMFWVNINEGVLFTLLSKINNWIFTPGLLLLSGFGLYYSFSNNSDLKSFYNRRIKRLFIPFVLVSIPLYLYFVFVREDYNFFRFVLQITTIDFWINGNYGGMWYVAVSMVLYMIFPLFYKFLFSSETTKGVLIKFLGITVLFYLFIVLLKFLEASYYETIEIGLSKMPYFAFGIIGGYFSKNDILKEKRYGIYLLLVAVLFVITYYLKDHGYILALLCGVFQKLFYISLITIILDINYFQRCFRYVYLVIGWFGTYSLELYLLHLHFYRFFEYSNINLISLKSLAGIALLLAIILCVPVHILIERLLKKKSL